VREIVARFGKKESIVLFMSCFAVLWKALLSYTFFFGNVGDMVLLLGLVCGL